MRPAPGERTGRRGGRGPSCAAPSRRGRGSPGRGSAERSPPSASLALSRSPALPPPSERVLGRHLDEDQGEAVGIARDHFEEAPRLHLGLLLDRYAPLRQPFPDGVEVAHLEERGEQRRRAARARCSRPRGGRRRERRRRRGSFPRPTRGRRRGQACPRRSGASAPGPGDEGGRGSRGSPSRELSPRALTHSSLGGTSGPQPGPPRRRPEIQKSVRDPGGGDSAKAIERDLTHP